ncbi:EamA-like transporter family protein [bacterium BMS3Abin05]|nr:EamA-like transporter family protein [bacterium BMS3Abin05]GBE27289.1 EamA-like transporter family protein [bacterium BMS3Bbin03]HDK36184.1 DMT family transporter [Bacteroidota bacterium]HDL79067.1 DMT family transporter [Bacteroidota bacterium]
MNLSKESRPEKISGLLGFGVLTTGVTAISFAAILIKLCKAPALSIAAYRMVIAAVLFLLVFLFRRQTLLKNLTSRQILLIVIAGFFLAVHFSLWISSLEYTSVASSVVLVTTNPLFVAIGSILFLKEHVNYLIVLAIFFTISGAVIIGVQDFHIGSSQLFGDVLALLAAIGGSGYLLTGRILRRSLDAFRYATLVYTISAVFLIFLILGTHSPVTGFRQIDYLYLLLLALVPQMIGHTSINWSLRFLSASFVAVAILGEPIGATLLAYFILHENVTWIKVLGAAFIILGILIGVKGESKLQF